MVSIGPLPLCGPLPLAGGGKMPITTISLSSFYNILSCRTGEASRNITIWKSNYGNGYWTIDGFAAGHLQADR